MNFFYYNLKKEIKDDFFYIVKKGKKLQYNTGTPADGIMNVKLAILIHK